MVWRHEQNFTNEFQEIVQQQQALKTVNKARKSCSFQPNPKEKNTDGYVPTYLLERYASAWKTNVYTAFDIISIQFYDF